SDEPRARAARGAPPALLLTRGRRNQIHRPRPRRATEVDSLEDYDSEHAEGAALVGGSSPSALLAASSSRPGVELASDSLGVLGALGGHCLSSSSSSSSSSREGGGAAVAATALAVSQ